MPSFEMNRLQSITQSVSGVSPTAAADRAKAKPAPDGGVTGSGRDTAGTSSSDGVAVEISAPAQSGPPVDTDRVAEIRSALRDGTYPLIPAKIADAMIAAQLKFEID